MYMYTCRYVYKVHVYRYMCAYMCRYESPYV